MIPTIIIVGLALAWLGYETDWLRIRLPIGATIKVEPIEKVYLLNPGKPVLLLDTYHFKPSQFVPLDMPETTGIKILCKRQ